MCFPDEEKLIYALLCTFNNEARWVKLHLKRLWISERHLVPVLRPWKCGSVYFSTVYIGKCMFPDSIGILKAGYVYAIQIFCFFNFTVELWCGSLGFVWPLDFRNEVAFFLGSNSQLTFEFIGISFNRQSFQMWNIKAKY